MNPPIVKKHKISRDLNDDMFIDCAIAAKAKYIVSGDNDLLCLKEINNIEILNPKYFLEILNKKSAGKERNQGTGA